MKYILWLLLVGYYGMALGQKQGTVAQDTTVYSFVEQSALLIGCEGFSTKKQQDSCTQTKLMRLLYDNIQYPLEAREKGIEGTVTAQFIVEKNGKIGGAKTVRDVQGGCGAEALRVLNAMNDAGIQWLPAKKEGKVVRSLMTIPIKFKLTEPLPYSIVDGDSVYTQLDKIAIFIPQPDTLGLFLEKNLIAPKIVRDSCWSGVMQVTVIILPDGRVKISDVMDFNELGYDALFETIRAVMKTRYKWQPAEYKGKKVASAQSVRLTIKPDKKACPVAFDNLEKSYVLAGEAEKLTATKELEKALEKLNEAVALSPRNLEILYVRGMLFLDLKKNAEACSDLKRVKNALYVNWVDSVLPFICK